MKEKIVFFGSSKFVITIIEALRKNFDLSLVITTEKYPTDPVPSYCNKREVPNKFVSTLSDPILKSYILNLKSQIGVLADFGLIVPDEILNAFPYGIINIHPSLLPKYRGPTPVQTAILNGDRKTGVTIIKLDEEVDHGPILKQIEDEILPNDTSESLYDRLFKLGADSIVSTIELLKIGKIKLRGQNHAIATFTKRLTREDGFIDPQNPPSKDILDRMIRAYYPWPGVWTRIGIRNNESGIRDKVLKFMPEKKIQVEGKKSMSYKDFINGYPETKQRLEQLLGKQL